MAIFGRFRIHCMISITRKSDSNFALISRVPVLNPGSQTTSWEPHNQLPIWDPLVSSQTLLTAPFFVPSPSDTDRPGLYGGERGLIAFELECNMPAFLSQTNSLRKRIYYLNYFTEKQVQTPSTYSTYSIEYFRNIMAQFKIRSRNYSGINFSATTLPGSHFLALPRFFPQHLPPRFNPWTKVETR